MDKEYARGWLRAFFDGEGCIMVSTVSITFANTCPEVITDLKVALSLFSIDYNVYEVPRRPPRQAIFKVRVTRRDSILLFIQEIGSSIPEKRLRMDHLIIWFDRPNQFRRTRHYGPPIPAREELERMRTQGMTRPDIARQLGIHLNTLGTYLKMYSLTNTEHVLADHTSPEELHHLYWDNHMKLDDIAHHFGCSRAALIKYMQRHGIPRRRGGTPPGTKRGPYRRASDMRDKQDN